MESRLHYHTVTTLLEEILKDLMLASEFDAFRLVGGTSLSLQIGHRLSIDIDLFTDAPYGSVDFDSIHHYLINKYQYVDSYHFETIGFGKIYFVGNSKNDSVKLDLYYTDPFIRDILFEDGIRLASIEEIIAMKVDVISRGGRKKDFWDLHELMNDFTIKSMIDLHLERYPFSHDPELIKANFIEFDEADNEFDPNCFKHKYWELIKLDFLDFVHSAK